MACLLGLLCLGHLSSLAYAASHDDVAQLDLLQYLFLVSYDLLHTTAPGSTILLLGGFEHTLLHFRRIPCLSSPDFQERLIPDQTSLDNHPCTKYDDLTVDCA